MLNCYYCWRENKARKVITTDLFLSDFLTMIDLCQLRAIIGLWCCYQISFTAKKAPQGTSTGLIQGWVDLKWFGGSGNEVGGNLIFSLALFVSLLLILSGDVELNHGPKIGDYKK